MLEECVKHELEILQGIQSIIAKEIKEEISCNILLPEWENNLEGDFSKMYKERISNWFTVAYGIYANKVIFTYNNDKIVPVKYPDNIRLSSHVVYERQQKRTIDDLFFARNNEEINALKVILQIKNNYSTVNVGNEFQIKLYHKRGQWYVTGNQKSFSSFLKEITSKKSLNKITINDIIKGCGVNRTTFYYHFQGIY